MSKSSKKTKSKKKKIRLRIIKWTSLFVLMVVIIVLFLLSDIFNVKEISVSDNNKVTSEEIISLSGIEINENMFKILKLKTIEKIKTNPYIEEVAIHRKLNGNVEINVKERETTFMLNPEEEQYVYINNQGYILEETTESIDKPIIVGYTTENIEVGRRLDIKDLKKLNTVIKIISAAKEKELADKITSINIENDQDYIVIMKNEGKTIHFGDEKNMNDKFVKLTAVLQDAERRKR